MNKILRILETEAILLRLDKLEAQRKEENQQQKTAEEIRWERILRVRNG